MLQKFQTLKDKELNLNADLSKKSVTVSAKGFEGEVTSLNLRLKHNLLKIQVMKWTLRKSNRIWRRTWRRNWRYTNLKTKKN
ncbi:hypothetical protein HYD72_03840 [Mycoplasmopsis bovis]|nr:hypothetical protein [Mycoplasmopsis bovis]QQH49389.1 hypothetical protein HYD72_03840 [Mycoplasmopsis bovis]